MGIQLHVKSYWQLMAAKNKGSHFSSEMWPPVGSQVPANSSNWTLGCRVFCFYFNRKKKYCVGGVPKGSGTWELSIDMIKIHYIDV